MNEGIHRGFTVSNLVDDVLEHLGIVIVAEAGHGKSYTAFTIVKEAMNKPNVTMIVFSPSTIWRRRFGSIYCVKVGTNLFNPIVQKPQTKLEKVAFLRDTFYVDLDKKWAYVKNEWFEELLKTEQHLLFEIKYKNGRRIKHFESLVLKMLYQLQERELEKNPEYNHHYIVVFEEIQNSFGTYSMNDDDSLELFTLFCQSRSDANIHYIAIGQRLADISTKVCERLRPVIGLTLGENSLRKIRAMIPKELRPVIQQLEQRTWIYLDGKENPTFTIATYKKEGKATILKPEPERTQETSEPKETFWTKLKKAFNPYRKYSPCNIKFKHLLKCRNCNVELNENEAYEIDGELYCQDCYNEEIDLRGIDEEWL